LISFRKLKKKGPSKVRTHYFRFLFSLPKITFFLIIKVIKRSKSLRENHQWNLNFFNFMAICWLDFKIKRDEYQKLTQEIVISKFSSRHLAYSSFINRWDIFTHHLLSLTSKSTSQEGEKRKKAKRKEKII